MHQTALPLLRLTGHDEIQMCQRMTLVLRYEGNVGKKVGKLGKK
jgi:hypothetical protein